MRWLLGLLIAGLGAGCATAPADTPTWAMVQTSGPMTPRHEAAFVAVGARAVLLGGRRINPVEVFDPATAHWSRFRPAPQELHHFQPVVMDGVVYIIGAMTGPYPNETAVDHVITYHLDTDRWEVGPQIPADRRRGGAGAVAHDGRIYIIGGITNGHVDGTVPWLDMFDPKTGEWTVLPDAPHGRDHFQAAVIGGRIYAFGGRRTRQRTGETFSLTVSAGDVFDIATGVWLPNDPAADLPTPRAGTMSLAVGDEIWVGGGESAAQPIAHSEVEAFRPSTGTWRSVGPMVMGRHGTGFVRFGRAIYTASGSGNRGGRPELATTERRDIRSTN